MGNDIRDSTGTNEEHSSLKLSVYSTLISKLDKTSMIWISFFVYSGLSILTKFS